MHTVNPLYKKFAYTLFAILLLVLCFPGQTFAEVQNISSPSSDLTQETLNSFNPLLTEGSPVADQFRTPGSFITRAMTFAFPLAGLILFVMLIWAGFEIVAGATDKKALDSGKQRATAAVIGFMLLFTSYWFVQLLEVIFGVQIL